MVGKKVLHLLQVILCRVYIFISGYEFTTAVCFVSFFVEISVQRMLCHTSENARQSLKFTESLWKIMVLNFVFRSITSQENCITHCGEQKFALKCQMLWQFYSIIFWVLYNCYAICGLMEGGKVVSFERMESVMCPESFRIRLDFAEVSK